MFSFMLLEPIQMKKGDCVPYSVGYVSVGNISSFMVYRELTDPEINKFKKSLCL